MINIKNEINNNQQAINFNNALKLKTEDIKNSPEFKKLQNSYTIVDLFNCV
jgi:hypothetical protein